MQQYQATRSCHSQSFRHACTSILLIFLAVSSASAETAEVEVHKDEQHQTYQLSVEKRLIVTSARPIQEAKAVDIPNSPISFVTWTISAEASDGPPAHFYSIQFAEDRWTEPRQASYMIRLKNRQFNPLQAALLDAADWAVPTELRGRAGSRLFLVQFSTQVMEDYRQAIRDLGAEVHDYLPEFTHLVRMDPAVAQQVAVLPYVRWVGPMHPYYKAEAPILESFELDKGGVRTRYVIVTLDVQDTGRLQERLQALGAPVVERADGSRLLVAELTEEQLKAVLADDSVQWVEIATKPEVDMDNARVQGGANFLGTVVGGYTGIGIVGHVMEGIYQNHPDFQANAHRQAPIAVNDPAPDDHGQNTYGEVFGSGSNDPQARGLLPDAQGLYTNYDFVYNATPGSTAVGSRHELVGRLIRDHRAMFQTASWGYARTTSYDARSMEMDDLIFEHDFPITQSQSNAGTQDSRPQAWAKNVISVGGVFHHDNTNFADDRWDNGASTGPASDGRIKPDLCAYYDAIKTTEGPNGYTPSFGGTSGATPIVAGHMGLCLEMWTNGIFGNRLPRPAEPQFRFENRPHFTTIKALLIGSARQYEFPPQTDLNRMRQGWGFPDLRTLYEFRSKAIVVNEDDVLKNLESKLYEVTVNTSEPILRITLVYADPGASPASAGPHRINDLDLKVIDPEGQVYWGNHGLLAGRLSVAGGGPDRINTVENVFLENPRTGRWKVSVIASELNRDSHRETPELDADYALVMLGVAR